MSELFYKYPSIENTYRKAFVDEISILQEDRKDNWVVQEKIHGANFSVIYDVKFDQVNFGKRTGLLKPDEKFYEYQSLIPELEEKMRRLKTQIPSTSSIVVFGELIGGYYPGLPSNGSRLQKGIDYFNGKEFVAFDLMVDTRFLSNDEMKTHLKKVGFKLVPEIGVYNS